MRVALAIAVWLTASGTAAAQDAGVSPQPDAAPVEDDASIDWEAAPKADEASGVAVPPSRGAKPLLWIPRVILFVPRWTLTLAAQPIRLAGWTYERYQVRDRFRQIFFNVEGTFGVFPVAFFETGFGLNAGARLIHKDLFGKRESVRMRASFGGRFKQRYEMKLATGDRFGDRWGLSLAVHYERREKERFFGLGNNDLANPDDVALPADPLARDVALDTRFRHRLAAVKLGADIDVVDELTAHVSSALALRRFEGADRADTITDFFDTSRLSGFDNRDSLLGFDNGVQNVYTELELRYDTRRRTDPYRTHAVPAAGWLLSGYGGYMTGIGADSTSFVRYGFDAQRYIDLYDGGRVLLLRAMAESIGVTDIDEIPFTDLPSLGGETLLRGHRVDRFRDRALALGQVEYIYDLVPQFSAYLFADAGRVFQSLRDFEFDDFRVGYGAGIRAHTKHSFLLRTSIATSLDGGVFFNFSFSPTTRRQTRAGAL